MAVVAMARTWLNILISLVDEARMVVSESGESLSPKIAPESTAPTIISSGTPMLTPTLTHAMPTVPAVPQEVPMQLHSTAHRRNDATRIHLTFIHPRP